MDVIGLVGREDVADACNSFRRRLQAVVDAEGGHFECFSSNEMYKLNFLFDPF